jgi:hypothetical protein
MYSLLEKPAEEQVGGALPENNEIDDNGVADPQLQANFESRLEKIRSACATAETSTHKVRDARYLSYIALYLWWVDLQQHKWLWMSYEASVRTGRRVTKFVKAGINFASLMRLGFARHLHVDDNFIKRGNGWLNKLHDEYTSFPQKYHTNAEAKLLFFLNSVEWGMTPKVAPIKSAIGSATAVTVNVENSFQASADQSVPSANETSTEDKKKREHRKYNFSHKQRIAHLLQPAKEYFANINEGNHANFAHPLVADIIPKLTEQSLKPKPHPLVVALVTQTSSGQFVVNAEPLTESNQSLLTFANTALVDSYRSSFTSLPNTVRAIAELTRTQMLVKNLDKHETMLLEDTNIKSRWYTGMMKAKQRMTFIKATGEFLLSPICSQLGVVSCAMPKTKVMETPISDVMLFKRSLSKLDRIMRTQDLIMYNPTITDLIPTQTYDTAAGNCIKLINRTDSSHVIPLDFQAVPEDFKYNFAQVQANWNLFKQSTCWSIDPHMLKTVNSSAVSLWLGSYGDHILRDRNSFVMFNVNEHGLTLHYEKVGAEYQRKTTFAFKQPQNVTQTISVEFRSKWLMTAINGIAALTPTQAVKLHINSYGLMFEVDTTAATHRIAIPAFTSDSKANSYFTSYTPVEFPIEMPFSRLDSDEEGAYEFEKHNTQTL